MAGHRPHRGFWCDSERNTLGARRVPGSLRFGRRINVAGRAACAYRPAGAHPSRRSGRGAACADSRAALGLPGSGPQLRAGRLRQPSLAGHRRVGRAALRHRRRPRPARRGAGRRCRAAATGTHQRAPAAARRRAVVRRRTAGCAGRLAAAPRRSTVRRLGLPVGRRAARGRSGPEATVEHTHAVVDLVAQLHAVDSCGPRRGGHRRPCAAATRRSRAGTRAAGGALDRWAVQRAGEGAPVDEGAGRAARADGVRRARRRRASGRRRVGRHARRAEAGQRARHP